jgi:Ca-activated chloride channel family protein
MVVPVEKINRASIKEKMAAINPKGKTPIAASLLQVAETLKGTPGRKTVILVTDGIESCDRDPCKVARELAASGVIAKIHIVGFDVTGEAMAQLKCIAEPSGGLLVGANNAEELKSALTDVVTTALPHNLVVKGLDVNHKSIYVSVKVLQAGKQVAGSSGSNLRYALPTGKYNITVRYAPLDQTIVLKDVAVTEDHLTEKEVVFAQSKLKVESLDGNNKPLYTSVAVYKAGTEEMMKHESGSVHVLTLPPGEYDVKVSHGPTKTDQWLRNLKTTAGGQLVEKVVFAQCKLKIKGLDGNNKPLYTSAAVYKAGSDEKIKEGTGSGHVFTLLPGVYDVKVTCSSIKEDKWLRNISLQADDELEQQVHFALGKIRITGFSPDGKKLYLGVTVYPAGAEEKIHQSTGSSPSFTLKPGAYDIHVSAEKIKAEKWLRGMTIENGADINQKVQF